MHFGSRTFKQCNATRKDLKRILFTIYDEICELSWFMNVMFYIIKRVNGIQFFLRVVLPAMDISREECDKIMRQIIKSASAKMSMSATFLHSLIYVSPEARGLGLPNLYAIQGKYPTSVGLPLRKYNNSLVIGPWDQKLCWCRDLKCQTSPVEGDFAPWIRKTTWNFSWILMTWCWQTFWKILTKSQFYVLQGTRFTGYLWYIPNSNTPNGLPTQVMHIWWTAMTIYTVE